jgi:hypothetical protein
MVTTFCVAALLLGCTEIIGVGDLDGVIVFDGVGFTVGKIVIFKVFVLFPTVIVTTYDPGWIKLKLGIETEPDFVDLVESN